MILSIGVIAYTIHDTGSFVRKGVSLSGGVSATITLDAPVGRDVLSTALLEAFPDGDFAVRTLSGSIPTYVVEAANLLGGEQEAAHALEAYFVQELSATSVSLETTGPSLGASFFNQTILGVLLAFLWMGWVVFLYFGSGKWLKVLLGVIALSATILVTSGVFSGTTGLVLLFAVVLAHIVFYLIVSVPSGAIILAAASTILFTLAVINLMGVRLSTAGVAAFLMIIGYSVDTDILVSTRVLKTGKGSAPLFQRLLGGVKTGLTMQVTTTVAVTVAFIVSTSEVISQIMLILLIGMVGDIIFTWLQNAGILYWYVLRKGDTV